MKKIRMKAKSVDDAVNMALEVLGGSKEQAIVKVINQGKPGMLGMLGGEEAEVEVLLKENLKEDARQILQDILDRMQFMAVVDVSERDGNIELEIKGEDMGRIIGKDGAIISSFEILLRTILGRAYNEKVFLSIDAGDYKKKRNGALERLAIDAADEVARTGQEKVLPPMSAADRRIIHLCLQENPKIKTHSQGEGRERRLVISPA